MAEQALEYCFDRSCHPGAVFGLAYRFTPDPVKDRLLVLQAFIDTLSQIPFEVSDQSVAIAKLGWWQQELAPAQFQLSRHPLVVAGREMKLDELVTGAYVSDCLLATSQLTMLESISDRAQLSDAVSRVGKNYCKLMAGAEAATIDSALARSLGELILIARLLQNPLARICNELWWIPMEDQARHSVKHDSQAEDDGNACQEVIKSIAEWQLSRHAELFPLLNDSSEYSGSWLKLQYAVVRKRLMRIRAQPARRIQTPLLTEVFSAWRAGVRIARAPQKA